MQDVTYFASKCYVMTPEGLQPRAITVLVPIILPDAETSAAEVPFT